MSAHIIRPFYKWLWDVTKIESICHLRDVPSVHSPFWWNCYRNNETPFAAVMHNYDWSLPSKEFEIKCIENQKEYEEFFKAPYDGIGHENPYVPFEF